MSARIERVMVQLGCTYDDAVRYFELRDEGYSSSQAKLMSGLSDPPDPDEFIEVYDGVVVTTPAPLGDV